MRYKVQIFLSTYNGEKYLRQQLDSLLDQMDVGLSILIRDDGSTDETISILKEYEKKEQCIKFYCGKNIGYAKSFLHLLSQKVDADYFSFCDQDDIWLPNKLINSIKKIEQYYGKKYIQKSILYTSALKRVNENLQLLGFQKFKNLQLSLGAEFTRHRLAGCTFVFNSTLYKLLNKAYYIPNLICSHDKLATILCIATGGKVIFDNSSYILFRRYNGNTSSDGKTFFKKFFLEFKHFFLYRNQEYNLAKIICKYYRKFLDVESYDFLYEIVIYKNNIKNKLALFNSRQIDCGFWYYNIFIRIMILGSFY